MGLALKCRGLSPWQKERSEKHDLMAAMARWREGAGGHGI